MSTIDRRRFERVRPAQPIACSVGKARVYILDGSISGVAILHDNVLPPAGDLCRLEVETQFGLMVLDCEVVRTVKHSAREGMSRLLCHSGLRVVAADHRSAYRLRTMFGATDRSRDH